jgi:hypothetical protein
MLTQTLKVIIGASLGGTKAHRILNHLRFD